MIRTPRDRGNEGSRSASSWGGKMFEGSVPKLKIGCVMLVMVGVGLTEFSSADVERVFAPLDRYLDQLMERGVDLVMQNGVPLPILIGIEAHDRMVAHMEKYTGLPATSTVLCVVRTA